MTLENWIAIGGLTLSIIGLALDMIRRNKKQAVLDAQREQKQADQHEQVMRALERANKRLDEHNGYAEKFAETAISMTAMAKDIEFIKEKLR